MSKPNPKQAETINSGKSGRRRSYERFPAILLMSAGIIYLTLWLISIFSETTAFIDVRDDKLSMKMSELLSHVRTVITIVLSLLGGYLIFKKNRWGWILGVTVLVLLLIICSGTVYQAIHLGEPILTVIALTGWIILLTSIVFLTLPAVRRSLKVNKPAVITTGLLSVSLVIFYFFLQ